jgi:hypothetical protein
MKRFTTTVREVERSPNGRIVKVQVADRGKPTFTDYVVHQAPVLDDNVVSIYHCATLDAARTALDIDTKPKRGSL